MWPFLLSCLLLEAPAQGAAAPAPAREDIPPRAAPSGRSRPWRRPPTQTEITRGKLLANLAHADPKLRSDAAWEAGRRRLIAAKPALGKLLRDRDVQVRRSAAWALGELGQPESAFPLQDRFIRETDPRVQAELAIALGKVRHLPARPQLLGLTWSGDPLLQAAGITAVGHLGHPQTIGYLLRFSRSPDPMLRRALAEALGRTGGREARRAILGLLEDPASTVQAAALEAASRLLLFEAAPHAERLLAAGQTELRRQAAATLRAIGSPRHLGALRALLEDELPEVRAEAALAMAHLGGELPTPVLLGLIGSRHNAAMRAAAQATGLAGNRGTIPALELLLDHSSDGIRADAARALGRLAATQSLAKLTAKMGAALPGELEALLGAIGDLRDTAALGDVASLISHEDPGVRAAAINALEQMARVDPRPFAFLAPKLPPLLGPRQPPALLKAAAEAFTRIPPPRPREGFIALMRLTLHPEAEVRAAAARSLGRYGDRLGRSTLEQLRRDRDPAVRLDASHALLLLRSPKGRGSATEATLPGCQDYRGTLKIRCVLIRASWLAQERGAAREVFVRVIREGPNTEETAGLLDLLCELEPAFALPLMQASRLSSHYLIRAAAARALSVWPPEVRRPRRAGPADWNRRAHQPGEQMARPRGAEPPLFAPGAPDEGCGCSSGGGLSGCWLSLFLLAAWPPRSRRRRFARRHPSGQG
ncbi:MAG: HEAT repeat domain-containing protein [Polyangia bacterium]|jgi:HEAT repeat protein|nr:HEAT repeat domain-containing protein [Polyangia bacterium]